MPCRNYFLCLSSSGQFCYTYAYGCFSEYEFSWYRADGSVSTSLFSVAFFQMKLWSFYRGDTFRPPLKEAYFVWKLDPSYREQLETFCPFVVVSSFGLLALSYHPFSREFDSFISKRRMILKESDQINRHIMTTAWPTLIENWLIHTHVKSSQHLVKNDLYAMYSPNSHLLFYTNGGVLREPFVRVQGGDGIKLNNTRCQMILFNDTIKGQNVFDHILRHVFHFLPEYVRLDAVVYTNYNCESADCNGFVSGKSDDQHSPTTDHKRHTSIQIFSGASSYQEAYSRGVDYFRQRRQEEICDISRIQNTGDIVFEERVFTYFLSDTKELSLRYVIQTIFMLYSGNDDHGNPYTDRNSNDTPDAKIRRDSNIYTTSGPLDPIMTNTEDNFSYLSLPVNKIYVLPLTKGIYSYPMDRHSPEPDLKSNVVRKDSDQYSTPVFLTEMAMTKRLSHMILTDSFLVRANICNCYRYQMVKINPQNVLRDYNHCIYLDSLSSTLESQEVEMSVDECPYVGKEDSPYLPIGLRLKMGDEHWRVDWSDVSLGPVVPRRPITPLD